MIRRPHQLDQRGYTLVELIVSSTIFIVIALVAVAVFVNVSQSSSKTAAQRKVQQDIRVNVEEIARTARTSRIDYDFYEKAASENQTDCMLPGTGAGTRTLALFSTQAGEADSPVTKRTIFFYDPGADSNAGAIFRYEADAATPTPTCAEVRNNPDAVPLTAENVVVTTGRFHISPLTDPYAAPCPAPRTVTCQLPKNTHPRVTMIVRVRTEQSPLGISNRSQFSRTTIQTTVGTRAYPVSGLVGQPT